MDESVKVMDGSNVKSIFGVGSEDVGSQDLGKENSETEVLLPPRGSLMTRNVEKPRRKVQWNDINGNDLTEVLEFQPSEAGDSDEEADSCICTIM